MCPAPRDNLPNATNQTIDKQFKEGQELHGACTKWRINLFLERQRTIQEIFAIKVVSNEAIQGAQGTGNGALVTYARGSIGDGKR